LRRISYRTEQAYCDWIKRFSITRAFLVYLVNNRNAAASTNDFRRKFSIVIFNRYVHWLLTDYLNRTNPTYQRIRANPQSANPTYQRIRTSPQSANPTYRRIRANPQSANSTYQHLRACPQGYKNNPHLQIAILSVVKGKMLLFQTNPNAANTWQTGR